MNNIRCSFLLVSAAALGLIGCASQDVAPQAKAFKPDTRIDAAQRALPTITNSVSQPAHYQHVFIDSNADDAGSLQTISLADAVENNVLASSEIQAKPLDKIRPDSLRWMVLEKGFARPVEIEGVGGANLKKNNFADVHFEPKKTEILERTTIDQMLKIAGRIDGVFHVVGYADESEGLQQQLSQERANVVMETLVAGGVNKSRVKAVGAGVSRTLRGLDANRRVSIAFRAVE